MSCEICKRFPVPTTMFEELEINVERHGALFQCKKCGVFFELLAEERSVRFTPIEELMKYYQRVRVVVGQKV
jgi:hypothetical protein